MKTIIDMERDRFIGLQAIFLRDTTRMELKMGKES